MWVYFLGLKLGHDLYFFIFWSPWFIRYSSAINERVFNKIGERVILGHVTFDSL